MEWILVVMVFLIFFVLYFVKYVRKCFFWGCFFCYFLLSDFILVLNLVGFEVLISLGWWLLLMFFLKILVWYFFVIGVWILSFVNLFWMLFFIWMLYIRCKVKGRGFLKFLERVFFLLVLYMRMFWVGVWSFIMVDVSL